MRVDPRYLYDFLNKASMGWQIEPLMLVDMDGIGVVSQTDRAKVYFTCSKVKGVGEGSGSVFVFEEDLAKSLKKYFKTDKEVTLELKDGKIVIVGKKEVFSKVALAPEENIMIGLDSLVETEYGTLSKRLADNVTFSGEMLFDEFKDLPDGPVDIDVVSGKLTIKVESDISSYKRQVDLLSSNETDGYVTVPSMVTDLPITGKVRLSIVDDVALIIRKVEDNRDYTLVIGSRRREV